ncbi:MAG: SDR family oxidoreductase [Maricaulaceae bacterium]
MSKTTKAVLITGAGARVGRHLAKGLAADGWTVVVHYNRSKDGAEKLVAEIAKAGGKAAAVQANLFVPDDVDSLIPRAAAALNTPLTALINNASTFVNDTAADFTRAGFDHHMEVNLRAPLLLTQYFADHLSESQKGCVINLLDQRMLKPNPLFFTYAISKSGLFWATKTLAQTLAPRIRVNAIGPGPTLENIHQQDGEFAAERAATLLGEGSPPETILDAARYLLSASAVTGQMIAVDGGQHLTWETPDVITRMPKPNDGA